jgi:tetratricopeptide (TPR) repeat protein
MKANGISIWLSGNKSRNKRKEIMKTNKLSIKKAVWQTVCLLVIGLMTACSESGVDENIALGDGFVERGEYENAADAYQVAVDIFSKQTETDPGNAKAWCNLGLAYRKQYALYDLIGGFIGTFLPQGKIDVIDVADKKAQAAYKKAIELKPDYAEAHCGLGRSTHSHSVAGLSVALPSLKKAVELKPDYAEAWFAIVEAAYWDSDEQTLVEEALAKATKLNYAEAWCFQGRLNMRKDALPFAIDAFEKAIKLHPGYTEAYAELGAIYEYMGEEKKAEEAYLKVLEINPNYAYLDDPVRRFVKKWKEAGK